MDNLDPTGSKRRFSLSVFLGWVFVLGLLIPAAGVGVISLSGLPYAKLDIWAQFTAPALVYSLCLGLVLLLFRRRRPAALAFLVSLVLLFAVMPQWSPRGPRPQKDAPVVRLYSANVHVDNRDVTAMRASIEAARPDIIVLVELGILTPEAREHLLRDYPHRSSSDPAGHGDTVAQAVIASRWPLSPVRSLSNWNQTVVGRVETPVGPVNVVATHFTRPWPYVPSIAQLRQAETLTETLHQLDSPVIVAGDFNSTSAARIGRGLRAANDLHPAPAYPGTWPTFLPSVFGITIDQVYASEDLAFVSRRIGVPMGSDHRPVVTEITRAMSASRRPTGPHDRSAESQRPSTPVQKPSE